jgi:hypothetical protein
VKQTYEAARDYKGRWGVFDTTARVWYYPPQGVPCGRRWAERRAKELNEMPCQAEEKPSEQSE